jgi:ketosteroid isomerase-like protein
MRNYTITLLFLAMSLSSFAQKVFDDKAFNGIMQRYEKDPVKFLQTETAPDFMLVGTNGHVFDLKGVMAIYDNITPLSRVYSDLKTRQYGNTGIATGSVKHTYTSKQNGATQVYDELFSYIFNQNKGKWQMVSAQHSEPPIDKNAEETAIKHVLDDETAAYLAGESQKMLSFWSKNDKTFHVGNNPDGSFWNYDNATIDKVVASLKPSGATAVKSNHRINIKGNVAIVDFDQMTTFPNGSTRPQHSVYLLEKMSGAWKFISASVHGLPRNAEKTDDEATIKKVLDEQVAAVYAGDATAIQKFYKDDPKAFHIVSGTAGEFFLRDNESIKSNQKLAKPRNGTPVRSNFNIKIVGNMATAHYDQVNTFNDGKVSTEHNLHILEQVNGEWKIVGASIHPKNFANEDKPDEILVQFITEYNKDATAFFMDRCPEDFRYTNGEGKFSGKDALKSDKTHTSDSEPSEMKVFKSGDLAVVGGIHTWKNKQKDGNVKVNKVAFTYTLLKKNGKWLFAASHHTPIK